MQTGVGGSGSAVGAGGATPGQAQQSGLPLPATLLATALNQLNSHACSTARDMYGDFLQHYPTDDRAAEAQASIAETYNCEGNSAAEDSVYQVVATKYPGTDEGASALYHHARFLCKTGKASDAVVVLNRIVAEDTLSTVRPDRRRCPASVGSLRVVGAAGFPNAPCRNCL